MRVHFGGGDGIDIDVNAVLNRPKGSRLRRLHELLVQSHQNRGAKKADADARARTDIENLIAAAFADLHDVYAGKKSRSIDRLMALQGESLSFYDDLLRTRSTPDVGRLERLLREMQDHFDELRKPARKAIEGADNPNSRAAANLAKAETPPVLKDVPRVPASERFQLPPERPRPTPKAKATPQRPSRTLPEPEQRRLETVARQRGIELDDLVDLATGDVSRADFDGLITLAQRSDATNIALLANELEKFGIPFRSEMLKHFPEGGDFDAGLAALRKELFAKGLYEESVKQPGATSPGAKSTETGLISQSALEQDVLDEVGITDLQQLRPTPGGALQPERFDVGNFGHTYADALVEGLPRGTDPEVTIRLPEGTVRRADRVQWNVDRDNPGAGGTIYEIKPNTGTWPQRGQRQAELYARYMAEIHGGTWNAVCLTYDAAAVRALVRQLRTLP